MVWKASKDLIEYNSCVCNRRQVVSFFGGGGGCAGSLLLCGFSLVALSGGYSLVAVRGLIIVMASLVGEHGL